jgi:hypothetical protein
MIYPMTYILGKILKILWYRSRKMKKIWIMVGVLGIAVLALGAAGLAYAQSETPSPNTIPEYGYGMMGGWGGYGGMRGGMMDGEFGPSHEYMLEAFGEAVGLSPEEIENRLASGETMWQIVEDEGLSIEEFGEIMSSVHSSVIEQALEDGTLTQEQADFMDQRMSHWGTGGFGAGFGDCMEDGVYGGFHHGRQGWRNTP